MNNFFSTVYRIKKVIYNYFMLFHILFNKNVIIIFHFSVFCKKKCFSFVTLI